MAITFKATSETGFLFEAKSEEASANTVTRRAFDAAIEAFDRAMLYGGAAHSADERIRKIVREELAALAR